MNCLQLPSLAPPELREIGQWTQGAAQLLSSRPRQSDRDFLLVGQAHHHLLQAPNLGMSGPALSLPPLPPPPSRAGLCAQTGGGGGLLLPLLEGSHPHSSRPGLSPDGTQVGTCGGWANAHPPLTTAAPRLGTGAFHAKGLSQGGAPMELWGSQLRGAGVHQGRARRPPNGLRACSRSQWGRGSPKACEGGGQGRRQGPGSTRVHPPAFWFQSTPFQSKRGGLFYFIFL